MAEATEVIVIRALDEASEQIAAVDAQLTEMGVTASEADAKVAAAGDKAEASSGGFSKLGMAGLAAAAGVAIIGAAAVKSAIDYQSATASIAAESGTSMKAAQEVADAFLSMGGKVEASAPELAAAYAPVAGELKTLYGHALNAAQATGFMTTADQLSVASKEQLGTVTKTLTDIMLSYGLKLDQVSTASSDLFNVSRGLGVPIGSLSTSLERIVPIARAAGMSMGQTGGFMLDLAKAGASGRIGMRYASQALSQLLTPSASASKLLDSLGVSLTNAQGKFIGLPAAIGELQSAFSTLSPAERGTAESTLFGSRAAAVMGTVIQKGIGPLQQMTAEAEKHGSVVKAAGIQDATWHGQMAMLKSSVDSMMISLGKGLLPAILAITHPIIEAVTWLSDMARKFSGVAVGILAAVGAIGGFIGAMMVVRSAMRAASTAQEAFGMVQKAFGAILRTVTGAQDIQAVSTDALTAAKEAGTAATGEATIANDALNVSLLANPITWIVVAVLALIAVVVLMVTHWKQASGIITGVWHDITTAVGDAVGWIVSHVEGIASDVEGVFTDIQKFVAGIWSDMTNAVGTFINDVVGFFEKLPGRIVGALGSLPGDIGGVLSKIPGIGGLVGGIGGLLSHLAEGGVVDKPTLAIIGEAGREFVIPESKLTAASPRPQSLPRLSMPGGMAAAGGSGASIVFDFTGTQVMTDADINVLADRLGSAITKFLPGQGIQVRR